MWKALNSSPTLLRKKFLPKNMSKESHHLKQSFSLKAVEGFLTKTIGLHFGIDAQRRKERGVWPFTEAGAMVLEGTQRPHSLPLAEPDIETTEQWLV